MMIVSCDVGVRFGLTGLGCMKLAHTLHGARSLLGSPKRARNWSRDHLLFARDVITRLHVSPAP